MVGRKNHSKNLPSAGIAKKEFLINQFISFTDFFLFSFTGRYAIVFP